MYLQNNEWLDKLVSQIRGHNHFHVFILRNLYHYRAVGACVARLILSFSLSVFDASTKLFCCSSDFLYIELFCHSYEKQNRNTLHSNSLSIYNYKIFSTQYLYSFKLKYLQWSWSFLGCINIARLRCITLRGPRWHKCIYYFIYYVE